MDESGLKSQGGWASEGDVAAAELAEAAGVSPDAPGLRQATDSLSNRSQYSRAMAKMAGPLAWLLLAVVVVVTLGPLSERPNFGHPQGERFAGFFALAAAWTFAYPNRRLAILVVLAAGAVGLELAQGLAPGRHPGLPDVQAKLAGVLVGVLLPVLILRVWTMLTAKR